MQTTLLSFGGQSGMGHTHPNVIFSYVKWELKLLFQIIASFGVTWDTYNLQTQR